MSKAVGARRMQHHAQSASRAGTGVFVMPQGRPTGRLYPNSHAWVSEVKLNPEVKLFFPRPACGERVG
jgi:hypothetical protein